MIFNNSKKLNPLICGSFGSDTPGGSADFGSGGGSGGGSGAGGFQSRSDVSDQEVSQHGFNDVTSTQAPGGGPITTPRITPEDLANVSMIQVSMRKALDDINAIDKPNIAAAEAFGPEFDKAKTAVSKLTVRTALSSLLNFNPLGLLRAGMTSKAALNGLVDELSKEPGITRGMAQATIDAALASAQNYGRNQQGDGIGNGDAQLDELVNTVITGSGTGSGVDSGITTDVAAGTKVHTDFGPEFDKTGNFNKQGGLLDFSNPVDPEDQRGEIDPDFNVDPNLETFEEWLIRTGKGQPGDSGNKVKSNYVFDEDSKQIWEDFVNTNYDSLFDALSEQSGRINTATGEQNTLLGRQISGLEAGNTLNPLRLAVGGDKFNVIPRANRETADQIGRLGQDRLINEAGAAAVANPRLNYINRLKDIAEMERKISASSKGLTLDERTASLNEKKDEDNEPGILDYVSSLTGVLNSGFGKGGFLENFNPFG